MKSKTMVINNWVRVTLNAKGYDKVKLSLLFMPRHCNAQDSFMSSKEVLELGCEGVSNIEC